MEIVGAWLRVWTAPKGVDVPPVPVRKLLVGGMAYAVVLAATLALTIPPVDSGKKKGAAERARQQSTADAAERSRLRGDQRPQTLRVAHRESLVAALEAAVTADAL